MKYSELSCVNKQKYFWTQIRQPKNPPIIITIPGKSDIFSPSAIMDPSHPSARLPSTPPLLPISDVTRGNIIYIHASRWLDQCLPASWPRTTCNCCHQRDDDDDDDFRERENFCDILVLLFFLLYLSAVPCLFYLF